MLQDSAFARTPMRTRIAAQVTNVSGRVVRPGAPKPVSRLDLSAAVLEPIKAVAQVVVTEELLAAAGPSSEAAFNRMLRGGVAEVVDQEFFGIIGQNLSPHTATAAPLDDLEGLLDDVNTTGAGALYWAMSPTTANAMAAHLATNGNRLFPEMTPVGGSILGLPALVSTAVPAAPGSPAPNTLWLIDASGIAGDTTEVEVRMSREAVVEMADNPTGDAVFATPLGTTSLVSLWQENLVAIEAEVRFAAYRIPDPMRSACSRASPGNGTAGQGWSYPARRRGVASPRLVAAVPALPRRLGSCRQVRTLPGPKGTCRHKASWLRIQSGGTVIYSGYRTDRTNPELHALLWIEIAGHEFVLDNDGLWPAKSFPFQRVAGHRDDREPEPE